MKATVLKLDGKKKGDIELPNVFSEAHRPDLIQRAFLADMSKGYQPYGTDIHAGFRTSAENWGTGAGRSRQPRVKAGPHRAGRNVKGHRWRSAGRWFRAAGRVMQVPGAVGGRRAHPPKPEKTIIENLNKKEKALALKSAIAATAIKDLVLARGHQVQDIDNVPIIIEDKFSELKKTKEVQQTLKALGLSNELERTSVRKIRAGKGTKRGRRYKRKTGPLCVIADEKGLENSASNIPGVDIVSVQKLNVKNLAPGAVGGRLTVWTEGAIKNLSERYAQ